MIRKTTFHLLSALAMTTLAMTACTDSYPGIDYDYGEDAPENTESYDENPLMVFVNEQNFFSISATRSGHGAWDDDNLAGYDNLMERSKDHPFYVYAFRCTKDENGLLPNDADMRTTLYDEKQKNGHIYQDCLLDASYGDASAKHGIRTFLQGGNQSGALEWAEPYLGQIFHYSAKYQDYGYNFFGYFIDAEDPSKGTSNGQLVRDKDSIYYKNFEIDGATDVMAGYAPKLTRELLIRKRPIWGQKSDAYESEINKILNIGGYSTYAAHREVHPEINIKHQLTRLQFRARAAAESLKDNPVIIKGISVNSKYRGDLVVAHQDTNRVGFHAYEATDFIKLRQKTTQPGVSGSTEFNNLIAWDPTRTAGEQKKDTIGESLMIVPDSQYTIRVNYIQLNHDYQGNETPTQLQMDVVFKAPKTSQFYDKEKQCYMFSAGKYYELTIGVFGLEGIEVKYEIDPWTDGGNVDIDPDGSGVDPDISVGANITKR